MFFYIYGFNYKFQSNWQWMEHSYEHDASGVPCLKP